MFTKQLLNRANIAAGKRSSLMRTSTTAHTSPLMMNSLPIRMMAHKINGNSEVE